jgi:hypothetical protein
MQHETLSRTHLYAIWAPVFSLQGWEEGIAVVAALLRPVASCARSEVGPRWCIQCIYSTAWVLT